jgi:hypothetical protein
LWHLRFLPPTHRPPRNRSLHFNHHRLSSTPRRTPRMALLALLCQYRPRFSLFPMGYPSPRSRLPPHLR